MKLVFRFFLIIALNGAAVLILDYFIPGFLWEGDFKDLAATAGIFTAINLIVRPLLKLVLTPFLIVTFGAFIVVINAACLYLLDILDGGVTIEGFWPLFLAALAITVLNAAFHLFKKRL